MGGELWREVEVENKGGETAEGIRDTGEGRGGEGRGERWGAGGGKDAREKW